MAILIDRFTKRLSDYLNVLSDVTPVLVCIDCIQMQFHKMVDLLVFKQV